MIIEKKIDRFSPIPLHEQLKQALRSHIAINALEPNTPLPSERELCERFNVSRTTVVKALNDLAIEGLVERVQGKGTMVANPRIHFPLKSAIGFSEAMSLQGLQVRTQVLSAKIVEGDSRVRALFGAPPHDPRQFVEFVRLRLIKKVPVVLAKTTVPRELGDALLKRELEDQSFYALYAEILGEPVVQSEEVLGIVRVNQAEAKLLQVPFQSSHFQLYGVSYRHGNIPIEATDSIFHGDFFRFQINMQQVVIKQQNLASSPPDHPLRDWAQN